MVCRCRCGCRLVGSDAGDELGLRVLAQKRCMRESTNNDSNAAGIVYYYATEDDIFMK